MLDEKYDFKGRGTDRIVHILLSFAAWERGRESGRKSQQLRTWCRRPWTAPCAPENHQKISLFPLPFLSSPSIILPSSHRHYLTKHIRPGTEEIVPFQEIIRHRQHLFARILIRQHTRDEGGPYVRHLRHVHEIKAVDINVGRERGWGESDGRGGVGKKDGGCGRVGVGGVGRREASDIFLLRGRDLYGKRRRRRVEWWLFACICEKRVTKEIF